MSALNKKLSFSTARRLRLRSTDSASSEHNIDFLKLIRDQMLFVATFFAVFGLIATDSYYSQFGMKYQFLGLDYTHILYRGFALLYAEKAFRLIFIAIIVSVLVHKLSFPLWSFVIRGKMVAYGLLIAALGGGGYLAFTVGARSAVDDMYVSSTSLQHLSHFYSNNKDKLNLVNKLIGESTGRDKTEPMLLLLHSSANEIVVFKSPTLPAQHPGIDIFHIRLSDNDQFSHASP